MKALIIIEWIIFFMLAVPVAYLFFFAVMSKLKKKKKYAESHKNSRIVIIIPAYKEDSVIEQSINAALCQNYPRDYYDIVLVADKFESETINKLSKLPIKLLDVKFENSSKAKALKYAVSTLKEAEYDILVILDADNIIQNDFLSLINDAYNAGAKVMQTHRKAKNLNTDIAILDAISEEMNNSILRKGHAAVGLSAGLIGSGMAFDYKIFNDIVGKLSSSGEDKEMEMLLLRQKIFIEYLEDVYVLDEKIQKSSGFYNQRRRWVAAQFYSLASSISDLPKALLSRNIDYVNKLIQWMFLPKILLMGLIFTIFIIVLFVNPVNAIKWGALLFCILLSFWLAIPKYLKNVHLARAFSKIPLLFVLMGLNLFRIKGAKDKFIHTDHGKKKIKIAIEAQRIFRKRKHGMDIVVLENILELQKLDKDNEYYIIVRPGKDVCVNPSDNFHIVKIPCPIYPIWEQILLPIVLAVLKPDLVHCTSSTAPLFCRFPLLLTIHDIFFMEDNIKHNFSIYQNIGRIYRRHIIPYVSRKAKKIISVSKYERERIIAAFYLSPDKVVTIYNGVGSHFSKMENYKDITKNYISDNEYLFFLGNTDPKKNTERVLRAYSVYLKKSENPKPLLIADLKIDVIDYLLKQNDIEEIRPYLRYPGYISNSYLPAIYSGAFAFLYPSIRESFGIPILESMACGTPVITSNLSSIPEIAGENAIMVNPYSEDQIACAIIRLEKDPDFVNKQIEYGLHRAADFSWKITACELLKQYKNITEE